MESEPRGKLLRLQINDGAEIMRLCENFYKDGPKRWTQKYLEKKGEVLDVLWARFDLRHMRIANEELLQDSSYVRKKCFDVTRLEYKRTTDKIRKEMVKLAYEVMKKSQKSAPPENIDEEHPSSSKVVAGGTVDQTLIHEPSDTVGDDDCGYSIAANALG